MAPGWQTADWKTAGLPLSYLAGGTGTVLARSGWGPDDVWASFQAAGRGAPDHQHCDAGHFALTRGPDDLAISTADYGTAATWNKNSLLFDDGGNEITYAPNQGPWGKLADVKITHFAELGVAVAAQADFAHAYDDQNGRSPVGLARREWVYLRPDLLIVQDRARVDAPTMKVTFSLHTEGPQAVDGPLLTAELGGSRLTSRTLLPADPVRRAVAEPDPNAGPAPWRSNDTWAEPLHRGEEISTGALEITYLHVLGAAAKGAAAPPAVLTNGMGTHVILVGDPVDRVVVLPEGPDGADIALPFTYRAPSTAVHHVLFGLGAADAYRMSAVPDGDSCLITVAAGEDPNVVHGDRAAAFSLAGCASSPVELDGGAPRPIDGGAARSDAGSDAGPATVVAGCALSRAGRSPTLHGQAILALAALLLLARRRPARQR
jgi:hypothetical protein